jgi:putative ABC transport system substrate-binding protein
MPISAGDPVGLHRVKIFVQGLQELGWTDGHNARIEYRWSNGDPERIQTLAKELVTSRPDVLVGVVTAQAVALRQATRTIPIVFVAASNLVELGVESLATRPGGNATGFTLTEPSMGSKRLELLKELVPDLRRVAVIFNPRYLAWRIVSAFGPDRCGLILDRGHRSPGSRRRRDRA